MAANDLQKVEFLVCTRGKNCRGRGSCDVEQALKTASKALRVEDRVIIRQEGCMCLCRTGPTVFVMPGWHQYGHIDPSVAEELVAAHVLHGKPVDRLLLNPTPR